MNLQELADELARAEKVAANTKEVCQRLRPGAEKNGLRRKLQGMTDRVKVLRRQLKNARRDARRTETRRDIDITDHAVVRYLERAAGVDIDAVRAEIRTADVLGFVRGGHDGRVCIQHEGRAKVWAVVADGAVVTVAPK